jgi:hypothetical protein
MIEKSINLLPENYGTINNVSLQEFIGVSPPNLPRAIYAALVRWRQQPQL